MSYELPIVTIDAWASPEIVENGRAGLLARRSARLRCYIGDFLPRWDTPQFRKTIGTADSRVVQGLVEKVSILIERNELRKAMGSARKWELDHGRFSIERRNEYLKEIFDEATG